MGVYILPDVEKVNDMIQQANMMLVQVWRDQIFFTWRWWLLIAIMVFSWVAWFLWRDKDNTNRLLQGGFVAILLATYMDIVGMAIGLWSYPTKCVPIPPYVAWDLCVIPVTTMFTLQIKPKVNPIVKSIFLALIGSFIMQPLAVFLGFYNPRHWEHYYSFPLVIIIYLIANHFYQGRKWKYY